MQSEAARRTGEYRLGQWVTLVVYENNLPRLYRRLRLRRRGQRAVVRSAKWLELRVTDPRHLRLQRDAAAFSFDPWTFPH